jgi:hypothetical protein
MSEQESDIGKLLFKKETSANYPLTKEGRLDARAFKEGIFLSEAA